MTGVRLITAAATFVGIAIVFYVMTQRQPQMSKRLRLIAGLITGVITGVITLFVKGRSGA